MMLTSRDKKIYAIYALDVVDKTTKELPLLPVYRDHGLELALRRRITPSGIFDELVILGGHIEETTNIGVVEKRFRPAANKILSCFQYRRVEFADDIPLITFEGPTVESPYDSCSELLQKLDLRVKPQIAYVELIDPSGNSIPGTKWEELHFLTPDKKK
jgi:hypothetical protein